MGQSQAVIDTKVSVFRRVGGNTLWVAAGRFADMLSVVLTNMVLARWLSRDDFKTFFVVFNVVSLLSICGTLGLNRSVVKFISEGLAAKSPERAASVLRWSIVVTLLGALVFAAVMLALTFRFFYEEPSVWLAAGLAVSVVFRALQRLVAEALRGYHEIRGASLFAGQNAGQAAGPIADFLFLLLVVAAWLLGLVDPSLSAVVVLNVMSVVATLPLSFWLLRRVGAASFSANKTGEQESEPTSGEAGLEAERWTWQNLLKVSFGILVTQFFIFLIWNSDVWLSEYLEEQPAADFVAARGLLMMVMLPLSLINMAVLSSIPELFSQKKFEELEKVLRTGSFLAGIPAMAVILFVFVFAQPIITLYYGPKYPEGGSLLAILVLGRILNAYAGVSSFALMMTGFERVHSVISAIAAGVLWLAGPYAAVHYGATGLAIVSAAVFTLHHAAIWLAVKKYVGVWSHLQIPVRLKQRFGLHKVAKSEPA